VAAARRPAAASADLGPAEAVDDVADPARLDVARDALPLGLARAGEDGAGHLAARAACLRAVLPAGLDDPGERGHREHAAHDRVPDPPSVRYAGHPLVTSRAPAGARA